MLIKQYPIHRYYCLKSTEVMDLGNTKERISEITFKLRDPNHRRNCQKLSLNVKTEKKIKFANFEIEK